MTGEFRAIWVYLAASPLLFLTLTLIAYQIGLWLHRRSANQPLVNPVLIAVVLLVGLLEATGTEFKTFFDGAQFVHFLLGPATVALAVPLYGQLRQLRGSVLAILTALLAGSVTASLSAIGIAYALGASQPIILSLAAKSVTTPIAMGIAEKIGGLPSLTAVLVLLAGMIGAMIGTTILNTLRIRDWRARGLSIGTAAHGLGTARAFQVNEVAGAFSSLAMGLNGLATALLLPVLIHLLFG